MTKSNTWLWLWDKAGRTLRRLIKAGRTSRRLDESLEDSEENVIEAWTESLAVLSPVVTWKTERVLNKVLGLAEETPGSRQKVPLASSSCL